jgi:hypothetical protein
MKKIGLIALAIVLALGTLGVGVAQWTETLQIDGDATMGEVDAFFRQCVSNDDAAVEPWFCINGWWMADVDVGDNGDDPTAEQKMGIATTRSQDVASTGCTGAWNVGKTAPPLPDPDLYKELTVTMSNVYPSYWATIFYNIMNAGTIPCKVSSIKLVQVSGGGWVYDLSGSPIDLVPCTYYCVSVDELLGMGCDISDVADPANCPPCTDFTIHISNDEGTLFGTLDPPYTAVDTAAGDLSIHIGDCAEEDTVYDFVIEFTVVAFNK